MEVLQDEQSKLSVFKSENDKLRIENNILKKDIGYWKSRHQDAIEREEDLKKELQDKKGRIKYLVRQLYEKKTEQSKKKRESDDSEVNTTKRKRGHQPGQPSPKRRDQSHLDEEVEIYDLGESEKYCITCGMPLKEMSDTDDSEVLETQEVRGYRRTIKRKKYIHSCRCPGNKGIVTAKGPAKLMPNSRYGASIWIHILIRKYRFQIPVARILKNLSLHGLSIPPGSAGDGLKRLAPLFEPVYAALEERSQKAAWWQADETRWSVFETTKEKSTFRWYLWVFISDESVVHVIDPTRSAQVIEDHFGTITNGILLVDRYSAYKSYAKKHEGITLAFCWAHARRDFRDAGLKYEKVREWAGEWEERIGTLFHLNNLRIQYAPGSSLFRREDKNLRELIAKLKEVLQEERSRKRLHHSQISVLKSLSNHWEGLCVFVDHPEIPMDNNGSERTLRNPVVGRKNYYGSGAIWSARFTAVMFSIFETLEVWKINQLEWLSDYFRACALAGGNPPTDVTEFLPWNIKEAEVKKYVFCGREFTESEIESISRIVGEDTTRNRTDISRIACEQLQWYKPDGKVKISSMNQVLLKMEAKELLLLPPVQSKGSGRKGKRSGRKGKPIVHTELTVMGEEILLPAGKLPDLHIEIVETKSDKSLWNEYIDRYHYLGYTPLPGAQMKYFVYSGDKLLALLGFGASAWRVAPRDWYIDWSEEKRKENLHLVINNARFLILPWVFSKNLASKILGMISRQIADDWQKHHNYRPVLLETFVEKERFAGTCYKAANWKNVGTTKGRGKKDRFNDANLPKKDIFMHPLQKDFRSFLC